MGLEPFSCGGLDGGLVCGLIGGLIGGFPTAGGAALVSDADPRLRMLLVPHGFWSALQQLLPQPLGRMPHYDPLAATMESKEADAPAAWVLSALASPLGEG